MAFRKHQRRRRIKRNAARSKSQRRGAAAAHFAALVIVSTVQRVAAPGAPAPVACSERRKRRQPHTDVCPIDAIELAPDVLA